MRDRLVGIVLFLPVPLVLWLFTRAPLGVTPSIVVGVVAMATHRLYARRFALSRADARCLWTGAAATEGAVVTIQEPGATTSWRVSDEARRSRILRFLGFAHRSRLWLRATILGAIVVVVFGSVAVSVTPFDAIDHADISALFRLVVALGVLPLGWLGTRLGPEAAQPAPVPFPVHIQALVGSVVVMWLFRIIGIVWLFQGGAHVAHRVGIG